MKKFEIKTLTGLHAILKNRVILDVTEFTAAKVIMVKSRTLEIVT